MAVGSTLMLKGQLYHFRSISLPTESHPIILRAQEELSKLDGWRNTSPLSPTPTAEVILVALDGLTGLYECVDRLFQLPLLQQLGQHQNKKWVGEMLDVSITLVDICSIAREVLLQMKERVQSLQSTLRRRRRGNDLNFIGSEIASYISFRRKMEKYITKCIASLKRIHSMDVVVPSSLPDEHHLLVELTRMLSETRFVTVSIFHILFSFMSTAKPKSKLAKWSLVSTLIRKGQVSCEQQQSALGVPKRVDVTLQHLCNHVTSKDGEMERLTAKAQIQLQELEASLQGLEGGLESMFRCLVRARVSLLNSFTY